MSADLYLNAIPDTPANRELLSKMREMNAPDEEFGFIEITDGWSRTFDALYEQVSDRAHVGEVSFAKAAVTDDPYWIPGPVRAVLAYFKEEFTPKVSSRAVSADVTAAMSTPDRSHYRTWHRTNHNGKSRRRRVKEFFAANNGALVFAVVD